MARVRKREDAKRDMRKTPASKWRIDFSSRAREGRGPRPQTKRKGCEIIGRHPLHDCRGSESGCVCTVPIPNRDSNGADGRNSSQLLTGAAETDGKG